MSSTKLTKIILCLAVSAVVANAYSTQAYRPYKRSSGQISKRYYSLKNDQSYSQRHYQPPQYAAIHFSHRPKLYKPKYNDLSQRPKPAYSTKLNKYQKNGKYGSAVKVPINTRHQIHFRDYPSVKHEQYPQLIEVHAQSVPLSLIFRSLSSKINVQQVHQPAWIDKQKSTYSVDEPHVLKHTVHKPIYQQVNEYIRPIRKIIQTVNPVQEEVITNLAVDSQASKYGQRLSLPNPQTQYAVTQSIQKYEQIPAAVSYHVGAGITGPLADYSASVLGRDGYEYNKIDNHVLKAAPVYGYVKQEALTHTFGSAQPEPTHIGFIDEINPTLIEPHVDLQKIQPVVVDNQQQLPLANYLHSDNSLSKHQVTALPTAGIIPIDYTSGHNNVQLENTYLNYANLATEGVSLPIYQASASHVANVGQEVIATEVPQTSVATQLTDTSY